MNSCPRPTCLIYPIQVQSKDRSGYLYLGILLFSSYVCVCACTRVCVCVCARARAWCLALMCSLLCYYGTISKYCYHSSLAVSKLSKGQYNILSLQND